MSHVRCINSVHACYIAVARDLILPWVVLLTFSKKSVKCKVVCIQWRLVVQSQNYKPTVTTAIVYNYIDLKHCPTERGVAGVNYGTQHLLMHSNVYTITHYRTGRRKKARYVVMKFTVAEKYISILLFPFRISRFAFRVDLSHVSHFSLNSAGISDRVGARKA